MIALNFSTLQTSALQLFANLVDETLFFLSRSLSGYNHFRPFSNAVCSKPRKIADN